jgi:hypothetical protein
MIGRGFYFMEIPCHSLLCSGVIQIEEPWERVLDAVTQEVIFTCPSCGKEYTLEQKPWFNIETFEFEEFDVRPYEKNERV